MKKLFTLRKIAFLILMVAMIIGVKAWASVQPQNQDRIRIENRTSALSVQSLRERERSERSTFFEIALRNVSPKPISALILRIEDEKISKATIGFDTIGGLFSYWSLQPGETKSIRFSAASTGNVTLTLAAVMFADGEAIGDAFFTDHLQKQRNGVKFAYQRILPILQKHINPQAPNIPDEAVQAMLNEIYAISERSIPQDLIGGFLDAKRDITSDIEYSRKQKQRDNLPINLKTKIQKIAGKIEIALSRL